MNARVPFNANDPENDWEDQFKEMMNPRCRYNPEYLNGLVAFESNGEGPQKPLAQGNRKQ